jgi:hypothetical protein
MGVRVTSHKAVLLRATKLIVIGSGKLDPFQGTTTQT